MVKCLTPIKAIRAFCVQCTNGDLQWIRNCPSGEPHQGMEACPLHPYRMGKSPNTSPEARERARERMKARILAKNPNVG